MLTAYQEDGPQLFWSSIRAPTPERQSRGLFAPTDGRASTSPQLLKTPHLCNLYQKVGMFGMSDNPGFLGGGFDFTGVSPSSTTRGRR